MLGVESARDKTYLCRIRTAYAKRDALEGGGTE
jgi:hypothetical protein